MLKHQRKSKWRLLIELQGGVAREPQLTTRTKQRGNVRAGLEARRSSRASTRRRVIVAHACRSPPPLPLPAFFGSIQHTASSVGFGFSAFDLRSPGPHESGGPARTSSRRRQPCEQQGRRMHGPGHGQS